MLRKKFDRRLGQESLEKRLMMDGNVTVVRQGAALIITGDNAANILDISGDGTAGDVTVDGIVNINQINAALAPTTVNGVDQGVLFTGITSIQMNMNGGDDDVNINNLVLRGPLSINDTAGNNTYDLGGHRFGVGSLLIQGNVLVNTAGGNNNVLENAVLTQGTHFIAAMGGNSQVQLYLSSTTGNESIATGAGSDVVGFGTFYCGGALSVNTGAGADLISAVGLNAGGDQSFKTGDGNDMVAFSNSAGNTGRSATIDTGAGVDRVTITQSSYNKLFALLGDGNDTLTVSLTKASQANFDGQAGTDTYVDGGGNAFSKLSKTSF